MRFVVVGLQQSTEGLWSRQCAAFQDWLSGGAGAYLPKHTVFWGLADKYLYPLIFF